MKSSAFKKLSITRFTEKPESLGPVFLRDPVNENHAM